MLWPWIVARASDHHRHPGKAMPIVIFALGSRSTRMDTHWRCSWVFSPEI